MERRIKALYIITIIAILSFLGMQAHWLYSRYEFSLKDYERAVSERIVRCVETYDNLRARLNNHTRSDMKESKDNQCEVTYPVFSLSQHYGDTVKTSRTVKILTYRYSAHDILGLEPGTPLTDELRREAIDIAYSRKISPVELDSVVYDASGAKDESEAWRSSKNVQVERDHPFSVEGIDSILNKAGISAQINITKADSMVWRNKVEYDYSVFSPKIAMSIPYSQLEGQTVEIRYAINPLDVLPGMWQTLMLSLLVSALLILCLVLQFSTVLKLSRLDKMRNNFITTMIHELKRPISTLKMCVSGMDNERMMEDRKLKKELLMETRSALDNLSAYFSKLRDITFNNVEQIPLNIQTLNLHELFDTVASSTASSSDKAVTICNEIDKTIEISADRSHLHNVVNNLVENAVKYSGPSVEIRAAAEETDGSVELRISDTGNGISAADLKYIFRRFYRGRASSGEQPGMGLGLAYVKLLVEAHGGDIRVESVEGKGTCFTIILPQ